eukprot:gene11419-13308_t
MDTTGRGNDDHVVASTDETAYNQQHENHHYEEEEEEDYDDSYEEMSSDDGGSNHNNNNNSGNNNNYYSTGERLLIYADKFIRNELCEIMEYMKHADKDRPVEEVIVHEIYLPNLFNTFSSPGHPPSLLNNNPCT